MQILNNKLINHHYHISAIKTKTMKCIEITTNNYKEPKNYINSTNPVTFTTYVKRVFL